MSGLSVESRIDWVSKAKGFAILCVVACHTAQQFDIHNGITRMADAGRYGVQLFFVISAFLTWNSFERTPIVGAKAYFRYLGRRIVRLIPVLYTAIIWNVANYCFRLGKIPDIHDDIWKMALCSSLFVNGFSYRFFNSWMTWYIGVYVMFVVIAPLIHRCVNSPRKSVMFFTVTAIIGWLFNYLLVVFCGVLVDDWFFYGWLPRQLPVLALGIVLYYFLADSKHDLKNSWLVFAFVVSVGFLLSMCAFTSPLELHVRYALLLTIFAYILFNRQLKCFDWLRPLGDYCYGIYLYHGCFFVVINALCNHFHMDRCSNLNLFIYFIGLVILSFGVAKLSDRFIEKPFFKLMNRLGL